MNDARDDLRPDPVGTVSTGPIHSAATGKRHWRRYWWWSNPVMGQYHFPSSTTAAAGSNNPSKRKF
jgi:hypothetical protein